MMGQGGTNLWVLIDLYTLLFLQSLCRFSILKPPLEYTECPQRLILSKVVKDRDISPHNIYRKSSLRHRPTGKTTVRLPQWYMLFGSHQEVQPRMGFTVVTWSVDQKYHKFCGWIRWRRRRWRWNDGALGNLKLSISCGWGSIWETDVFYL